MRHAKYVEVEIVETDDIDAQIHARLSIMEKMEDEIKELQRLKDWR